VLTADYPVCQKVEETKIIPILQYLCAPPCFAQLIQVIIFILASTDTMRCYGKDDDDRKVRNTVSKVMGAEESRAEGIAQSLRLTRVSQLLSLLYQSGSSQICPHGPVLVHLLVQTCAHRCYRLLELSDSPIKRLGHKELTVLNV
jgi:hypothetical protein